MKDSECVPSEYPSLLTLYFCRDWNLVKERVREHPDFDHFFLDHHDDEAWMETDLFNTDASENRIPFQILEMPDAETVFKNHLNHLNAHQKILE